MIVDRTSRRGNPLTIRAIVAEHQALGITLTDVDAAAIVCRRYAEWLDGARPGQRWRSLPCVDPRDRSWS